MNVPHPLAPAQRWRVPVGNKTSDPGTISVMVDPIGCRASPVYTVVIQTWLYVFVLNVGLCLQSVSKGKHHFLFWNKKRSQSAYFSDGEFLPVVDTLFAFTCLTGSFFYLLLFVRRFGSPRNLNVTHGCARGFTLRVSPVPCLAHINIPVSLSHE